MWFLWITFPIRCRNFTSTTWKRTNVAFRLYFCASYKDFCAVFKIFFWYTCHSQSWNNLSVVFLFVKRLYSSNQLLWRKIGTVLLFSYRCIGFTPHQSSAISAQGSSIFKKPLTKSLLSKIFAAWASKDSQITPCVSVPTWLSQRCGKRLIRCLYVRCGMTFSEDFQLIPLQ